MAPSPRGPATYLTLPLGIGGIQLARLRFWGGRTDAAASRHRGRLVRSTTTIPAEPSRPDILCRWARAQAGQGEGAVVKGSGALVSTVSQCRLPCASSAGRALIHRDPPDQFVTAARDFHQRCNIRQSCGRLMRAMNKPILSRAYLLSLPERGFRAGAAVAGGLLREMSDVVLPEVVRDSRLYRLTIARLIRLTVELVGDVRGVYPADELPISELATRKAAGNLVEVASVLAVGWSPVWVLAAASDISGGTRVYLHALVAELQARDLLPREVQIESVEDLLGKLEQTSGLLADTVDVPPLQVAEMRASWAALKERAADLPDATALAEIFAALQAVGAREGQSLLTVSAAVGAGAVRAGLALGDTHIFGYYREAVATIGAEGLVAYLRRSARPYLVRARAHFDPQARTLTDQVLRP